MFNQLLSIIESDEFKYKLNELNDNFFNLKQEIHIRNLLVELFNQKHKEEGERAIAEYRVPCHVLKTVYSYFVSLIYVFSFF